VYLVSEPAGPRLADFRIATSTRKEEIAFDVAVRDLAPDGQYALSVRIDDNGREVAQPSRASPSRVADARDGRLSFAAKWLPEKLWNVHTPQNMYRATISLLDAAAKFWTQRCRSASGSASSG